MILEISMNGYMKKFLSIEGAAVMDANEQCLNYGREVAVEDVMSDLGIPLDEVSVITFNDQKVSPEDLLSQDGLLRIFPSIIGG